jgi:hypothetical protein
MGWDNVHEYVLYLTNALIPDLFESGRNETATDFMTAVDFLTDASIQQLVADSENQELIDRFVIGEL